MDGVPVSMRWEKPNVHGNTTRGYLRMKEKLYRGSINEMFQKFSLSGRGRRSDTGATTAVAWTNSSSNNAKNVKEEAIEKRRRRMQYGDRMAVRFKKKKRAIGYALGAATATTRAGWLVTVARLPNPVQRSRRCAALLCSFHSAIRLFATSAAIVTTQPSPC